MDKFELRKSVMEELDYEPSIDAAHIGVAVDAGVVTLSGHVTSYPQKLAAGAAARRVKGVRGLADEIEVRYPTEKQTADDQIAKRALDILTWDASVPANSIQVTVRNGWVTLTGSVDWQFQRQAAEKAVRRLSGVTGITNTIDIKVVSAAISHAVKAKIEAALTRRAELEATGIRVAVRDGGHVVLEGTVDNWAERMAVENAAWSAHGVRAVEDKLRVA